MLAFVVVVAWGCTGPVFRYSDTWQLVMNTTSSIVAIHLKLDELLRSATGARTSMVDLEALSDDELERLQRVFKKLREKAMRADRNGKPGLDAEPRGS